MIKRSDVDQAFARFVRMAAAVIRLAPGQRWVLDHGARGDAFGVFLEGTRTVATASGKMVTIGDGALLPSPVFGGQGWIGNTRREAIVSLDAAALALSAWYARAPRCKRAITGGADRGICHAFLQERESDGVIVCPAHGTEFYARGGAA